MAVARRFMEEAIRMGKAGVRKENSPFGCCIVKGGRIVALAHNTVLAGRDGTNHAEMNAVRAACRRLKSHELRGCTVYSTTEPCPMCFSAIHWVKADAIVYGTAIADVKALGFSELTIGNAEMKRRGGSRVRIRGSFMRKECLAFLDYWKARRKGRTY